MKSGSKKWAAVGIFFLLTSGVFAYEASLPNYKVPSALSPVTLELDIQHRFGRILSEDRAYSFFDGANTSFGLRLAIWRGLDLYGGYATNGHAFSGGAAYSHSFSSLFFALAGGAEYFSFELTPHGERGTNGFYYLTAQSIPILGRITISGTAGYDAYLQHFGAGLAGAVTLMDLVDIIAEYSFPPGSNTSTLLGSRGGYSAGIKINTAGHHFKIFVSNSTGIGTRLFLSGARGTGPHVGFSIERLFRF